jgi:DNA invertase Pin-like site-specific DNA recombinase/transcription initiation factor TFIIIB Brf1 subunit/transcription initiation factor TFIIB
MDISSNAGGAGSFSFDPSSSSALPSTGRGRVRSADFGLPERSGLLDLARTYLETQARLWPDLVGTAAVPAADAATIAAMADGFERRFRQQHAEVFRPGGTPAVWLALAVAYLRFSDENSNPRSLDQQLLNVLNRARRDGVFVPWCYVMADAAVSGTLACRTGYTLAKTIVERRDEFGVSWFLIDDLSRLSRNTIESLRHGELAEATGVRVVGSSDGYDSANPQSSLLLPVLGSMNEAFITQLRSKVKRGMDDAFRRGDNIQPPGVGYRLVDVKDAHGNLVITHKNTIEKVVEIDPEAADWTRRGAAMIAYEGKSAIDVARLFNERKVGGKQTWSDSRVRQHYARERLVGKDVLHKSRQATDRQTGKKKVIYLPKSEWIWRDVPHLRILTDELAKAVLEKLGRGAESFGRKAKDRRKKASRVDLYPKVLIRPICGGCGNPMILGRSDDKYQSFFCFNANNGIQGCANRGYKSARIIDDAVLGRVMATLFTDDFLADLTFDVNKRLAWIARQPVTSTEKLEQEIANEDRQLKRLTDRLEKLDDTHLDAVIAKAEEMGRQLAAKRERLKELQRAGQRPKVKSVREQDVVAALGTLRELLQGDVGVAAQVLKALVGDVVVEARKVEGKARPEMVARFTINAIPAMALLARGQAPKSDDPTVTMWEFLHGDRWTMPSEGGFPGLDVTVPLRKPPKYEVMLPQIVAMAEAGSGVDLISRALGIGAEVVRDALHLHRTGRRPPGRVDGRRRKPRQPGKPFVPKYQQIAPEVDRRRKAGEGFDRLAREMKVSRPTVVRAYDFANRDEAAAAAREGRSPTRPPYRWSEESRAAKRKPRDA